MVSVNLPLLYRVWRDTPPYLRLQAIMAPRDERTCQMGLGPTAEDPAKRPLLKINGKKNAAKLMKSLDSALKKFNRR